MKRPLLFSIALLVACAGGDASSPIPVGTGAPADGGTSAAPPAPTGPVVERAEPGLSAAGVTYGELAADFDRFKAAVVEHGDDPEATTELFFVGLIALRRDRDEGYRYLARLLPEDETREDPAAAGERMVRRSGRDLLDGLRARPEILDAFCGATQASGFADADLDGCRVGFHRSYSPRSQGVADDRAAFFIDLGEGGDRPRPVKLKREDGRWRVSSYTGLLTGLPKKAMPEHP